MNSGKGLLLRCLIVLIFTGLVVEKWSRDDCHYKINRNSSFFNFPLCLALYVDIITRYHISNINIATPRKLRVSICP